MKPRYIFFIFLAFVAMAPLAFAQTASNSSFVPLTQIPVITQFANSSTNGTLASFFNSLYEYCVGLAAALAVVMIIWGGVTWMTAGDSTEKVSQARTRIGSALFGLVLVLSPTIVFAIINPNVLTLSLNFSNLTPSAPSATTATATTPAPTQGNAGATIAPSSTIQATGLANPGCTYIPNGTVIDGNNNSQVQCCGNETSAVAICKEQARTNNDLSQTDFCGCTIRPNISLNYYNYYSQSTAAAGFAQYSGQQTLIGIAPTQKTQHDQLVQQCTQAGGKINDTSTQGLLQSQFTTCPSTIGIPTPPSGTTYICAPRNAACVSQ